MILGIEIGGTKLQLGIGGGHEAELVSLERFDVDIGRGATGILEQIERSANSLLHKHEVRKIGVGFGGPVDVATGSIVKSHQVPGWENVALQQWCERSFGVSTAIANDCDAAALAEATWGAARGRSSMFYVTVGTGVGGGYVVDGRTQGAGRPAIAEIGHLRPGLHSSAVDATVESLASGTGIAAAARARVEGDISRSVEWLHRQGDASESRESLRRRLSDAELVDEEFRKDLLQRAGQDIDSMTAKIVAQAAAEGNEIAREVIAGAIQALGWAIAQTITLLAPQIIVVGGGVSLIGNEMFFAPLREKVNQYVFPPLLGSFEIQPAELEELAVVHGAIAIAMRDSQ